jgi:hypothetical protein
LSPCYFTLDDLFDSREDGGQGVQHLIVTEAEDSQTIALQVSLAFIVGFGLLNVYRTIDFDHEAGLDAVKVNDEWTDRVLTSKLEALHAFPPYCLPKAFFRLGRLPSHLFCLLP